MLSVNAVDVQGKSHQSIVQVRACVRVCPLPRCLSSGPLLRCGERTSDRSDDGPCASYSSILDAAHAHARNHSPGPAISLQAVVNGGDNLVLKVVRIDAVEAARLQNLEDVNEGAFCALPVTKGTQSMVHHLLPTSGLFPTVGFLYRLKSTIGKVALRGCGHFHMILLISRGCVPA